MSIFLLDKKTIVNIIYIKEGRKRMIDADKTGRYKKRTDSDISKTENDLIDKIILVIILLYLAYVK